MNPFLDVDVKMKFTLAFNFKTTFGNFFRFQNDLTNGSDVEVYIVTKLDIKITHELDFCSTLVFKLDLTFDFLIFLCV